MYVHSVLICYASEKGTAQALAEDLHEEYSESKFGAIFRLSCASKITDINKLKAYDCIVFIGSTTGDGDPPDTAEKFMINLRKYLNKGESLRLLHYTVLGLGDTNYNNFCNFGKNLDETLQQGNAQRFYNCGWADDGTGLEIVVEPWLEGLKPVLTNFLTRLNPKQKEDKNEIALSPQQTEQSKKANSEAIANLIVNASKMSDVDSHEIKPQTNLNGSSSNGAKFCLPESSSEANEIVLLDSLKDLSLDRDDIDSKYSTLAPKNEWSGKTLHAIPSEDDVRSHHVRHLALTPESTLTLPKASQCFINLEFDASIEGVFEHHRPGVKLPLADSAPLCYGLMDAKVLAEGERKTLEVTLTPKYESLPVYEPGDSFSILTPNDEAEVSLLLSLLGEEEKADMRMTVLNNPAMRGGRVVATIPEGCSLRQALLHCVELRAAPKKALLCALASHAHDADERRRIEELSSREGAADYTRFIRDGGACIIDLMLLFPSLKPPAALLLAHLPPLRARPYSATSSPLASPGRVSFAFNVVEIPKGGCVTFDRQGICTGWLNRLSTLLQSDPSVYIGTDIWMYSRSNTRFRLPQNPITPLVLIGPGTGVAPFVGFLRHLQAQRRVDKECVWPRIWLFFGCRRQNFFLFESEIRDALEKGLLTELFVCFSREETESFLHLQAPNLLNKDNDDSKPLENHKPSKVRYVQDIIRIQAERVGSFVRGDEASVYVCGDAARMSVDVADAFVGAFETQLAMSNIEARRFLADMQLKGRYLQDVWA